MSIEDEVEAAAQADPASADADGEAPPAAARSEAGDAPAAEPAEAGADAEAAAEADAAQEAPAGDPEGDPGAEAAAAEAADAYAEEVAEVAEDAARSLDAEPEREAAAAEPADEPPAETDAAAEGAFALHGRARMEETEALLDWLRAAPEDAPMTLDASAVENVSTPYVLAIVGAARARAGAGRPVAVVSPSPAFVDAFSDLGLFGDLMKMEIRP